MVRLKDIAAQAGVSVMTVSKALRDVHDVSENTKLRIKALAQQMGYVPDTAAQGLRTRMTKYWGLVISSLTNPVFARIALAIEERAHELGYDLILAHAHNQPEREEQALRRMLARRVDALFVAPTYRLATEAPVYRDLAERGIPVVLLGHRAPFCQQFISVASDDLQGGYLAARHLLDLGHRRIAFFAGPTFAPWSVERLEGYRRALREAGLRPDDRLVFQAGRTIEEGVQATEQMLNEACDATAVLAASDLIAVGAATALLNRGRRIPEDVSIVGHGNILLSTHFRVPLTTVRQPKFALGKAAADIIQRQLRQQKVESRRLPVELIVRKSSAPPAASATSAT